MKASTERKIIRWVHILLSVPPLWFIYGPAEETQKAAPGMRFIFIPIITLSGFWLWKGHFIKKWFKNAFNGNANQKKNTGKVLATGIAS